MRGLGSHWSASLIDPVRCRARRSRPAALAEQPTHRLLRFLVCTDTRPIPPDPPPNTRLHRPDRGRRPGRAARRHRQPESGLAEETSLERSSAPPRQGSSRGSSATTTMRTRRRTCSPSRRRCAASTRQSPRPGSLCRSTARTWRWPAHPICRLNRRGIPHAAGLHIEALNHALAAIPPERMRMHLCWGNYEGLHHHDVPLAEIIDVVFRARPATISVRTANRPE